MQNIKPCIATPFLELKAKRGVLFHTAIQGAPQELSSCSLELWVFFF